MIFLTSLEWSITKLAPHYIWQGTDEWFILPAEGEQHWYSLDWVFIHTTDISVEEVLVGVLIEIVVGLSIAVLILYYWKTTRKAIKKPKLTAHIDRIPQILSIKALSD